MATSQISYIARDDTVGLNEDSFSHPLDSTWTQTVRGNFRVRFAVSGTGTVGGTLEASTDGTTFFSISDTSGTAQAARSECFSDGDATEALLTSTTNFVSGAADEQDGAIPAVTLASQHTELEYSLRLIPADVSSGGTIYFRVAGLSSYPRTAQLLVQLSDLDRVRLRIGDTDMSDPLLSDAEIQSCLADWPNNVDLAAANAAEAIAAQYSRGFNFTTERQVFNRSERVNHYTQLAANLRKRGSALTSA